jgi:hypothetical protein
MVAEVVPTVTQVTLTGPMIFLKLFSLILQIHSHSREDIFPGKVLTLARRLDVKLI